MKPIAESGFESEVKSLSRTEWRQGVITSATDLVIEETPVALVYNGISHVVMMVTPCDLEDFALGFSLSEGILASAVELLDFEIVREDKGLELRLTVVNQRFEMLKQRRRNLTGRTGCGLCGAESLAQAIVTPQPVQAGYQLNHEAIDRAIGQLKQHQRIQQATGAAHAAAWCDRAGTIVLLREDVGRHNALDKLLGARERLGSDEPGFVLITSRASYEMVVKSARLNIGVLVAVSAPTALAIGMANDCNITLVGFTEPGRHVLYSGELAG
ncbi:MAG: formate dehydrogenase accessory sulfurtransferase FdhD [Porticoccaceae bacterium]|jgi:FdhD protein